VIKLQIKVSSGVLVNEKKRLKSTLRSAGTEVAAAARAKLKRSAGNGRKYYVGGSSGGQGAYRASAPGTPPATITGQLARSIKPHMFKNGQGVAIRASQFYAKFLEAGAKGGGGRKGSRNSKSGKTFTQRVLLPRPFLTAVLDERANSIGRRMDDAIKADVKFQKEKA